MVLKTLFLIPYTPITIIKTYELAHYVQKYVCHTLKQAAWESIVRNKIHITNIKINNKNNSQNVKLLS